MAEKAIHSEGIAREAAETFHRRRCLAQRISRLALVCAAPALLACAGNPFEPTPTAPDQTDLACYNNGTPDRHDHGLSPQYPARKGQPASNQHWCRLTELNVSGARYDGHHYVPPPTPLTQPTPSTRPDPP